MAFNLILVLIHMLILLAQSEHLAIVRLTVEIMRYKQPVVPQAQCYCQYCVPQWWVRHIQLMMRDTYYGNMQKIGFPID